VINALIGEVEFAPKELGALDFHNNAGSSCTGFTRKVKIGKN